MRHIYLHDNVALALKQVFPLQPIGEGVLILAYPRPMGHSLSEDRQDLAHSL